MHEEDRGHTYALFTGHLLFIKDLCMVMVKRFRITLTANVNLYHVTIASDQGFSLLYLSFTVLYFYKKKNITFTLSSSMRIVLDCSFVLFSVFCVLFFFFSLKNLFEEILNLNLPFDVYHNRDSKSL